MTHVVTAFVLGGTLESAMSQQKHYQGKLLYYVLLVIVFLIWKLTKWYLARHKYYVIFISKHVQYYLFIPILACFQFISVNYRLDYDCGNPLPSNPFKK